MRLIIINSSNFISSDGSKFSYVLPQTVKFDVGSKVGIASLSIYNSFFNVTSALGNNTLTFKWNSYTGSNTINITIPDGYYSSSDLNYLLQFYMVQNGYYMSTTDKNIFFFEIVQNPTRYAIQLNAFPLPTTTQATALGYSMPASPTWSLSPDGVTSYIPQLTFGSSFGSLIGLNTQTWPPNANLTTNQYIVSTKTPVISPVNSIIFTSNLINNRYAIPNNILMSMPINGSIGTLLSHNSSDIVWSDIATNHYNKIDITLLDQNFNKLGINDTDLVITLAIRDAGE